MGEAARDGDTPSGPSAGQYELLQRRLHTREVTPAEVDVVVAEIDNPHGAVRREGRIQRPHPIVANPTPPQLHGNKPPQTRHRRGYARRPAVAYVIATEVEVGHGGRTGGISDFTTAGRGDDVVRHVDVGKVG